MNRPSYLLFKKCSKCGEILHVSKFHKIKNGKYGVMKICKECRKIYNNKYREEHKEEIKKYREDNKDYYKEYSKQYYEENKDYYNEYYKKYYEENKEEISEYQKKYYEDNKEDILKNNKKYYEENKEKISEYKKKWFENNPEKIFNNRNKRRSKEENQGRGITEEQWKEMMDFFNWTCAYSGEYIGGIINEKRTVDHIIPLSKEGENEPWNLVPMLKSYNNSKHTKDMLEWYLEQEFFSIERLTKIYEWRVYAYWKWKDEI